MSSPTTIEGAVVALLTGEYDDSLNATQLAGRQALTALIGARIHPFSDPQSIPRPKLTYQRTGTNRSAEVGAFTNDGPTGLAVPKIQFDAWCDSLLTAKQVISAVRDCLNGFFGSVGGISIGSVQITNERELAATLQTGQQKPIQRVMCEATIMFGET